MNNDFNNEILTEELRASLNEKLKAVENLPLPKSLAQEKISKKLQLMPQPKSEEKPESIKKKNSGKIIKYIALAASFILVASTIFIIKPWDKDKLTPEPDTQKSTTPTEDYSQIENMFLSYKKKYDDSKKTDLYSSIIDGATSFFQTDNKGTEAAENVNGSSNTLADTAAGDTGANRNYGETNEQVEGVNESDIIKNDGKYIYTLDSNSYYNGYINIFEPQSDGKIKAVSKTKIKINQSKNYDLNVFEMFVTENKLIVFITVNDYQEVADSQNLQDSIYRGSGEKVIQKTSAIVYDITNKTALKELFRIEQDGSYISSRLIGNKLILISNYYVSLADDENEIKDNCIPRTYENGTATRISSSNIHTMNNVYDTSYIVASAFDITDKSSLNSKAVLGAGENIYCTAESLYVTNTNYSSTPLTMEIFGEYTEDTQIHKFDISNEKIQYKGSNRVKGRALNQFSIDEFNGYLRIATTIGTWGDDLSNSIFILDKDLNITGEKNNIAKGETIKSVRFAGDTGYVVTFEQTDPLFVIDLSDPQNPEIKGELKIPGFSTYLHPVSDTLLLGVGQDGTKYGTNGGLKVSLFDVSDPKKPKEVSKITVSVPKAQSNSFSYISCAAYYSHKALCYDEENKVIYIPYGIYHNDYSNRSEEYSQSVILTVKIDTEEKSLTKGVDFKSEKNTSNLNASFERATYIDNILFGYTPGECLTGFNIKSGKITDKVSFND